MKRNVLFVALLAAALVLGLGGCSTDVNDDDPDFDYAPWVGTWVIDGMPGAPYTSGIHDYLPPPYNGWTVTFTSDGTFCFEGNLLDFDTEAYGKFNIDPDEPGSFYVVPLYGTWHNRPTDEDGVDENGDMPIDEMTLLGFGGYVNRVLEEDGTWIMSGEDLAMFDFRWKKQP